MYKTIRTPKISIIVPVYNKNKYIPRMLECITNQTFRDFEVLIVDDGSTDGSGSTCENIAARDERIEVIHTENRGVSAARNLGIKNAAGKYICFVDADDWLDNQYLEKLYNAIKLNKADMSTSAYIESKKSCEQILGIKSGANDETFELILSNSLCNLWNKLFIKEKIAHMFDESISTCEDCIFCLSYYLDNKAKIAWVSDTLYKYIIHDKGLTQKYCSNAMRGVNQWYTLNVVLAKKIKDKALRKKAFNHINIMYLYIVYTFIFENLSKSPLDDRKKHILHACVCGKTYQKVVKSLLGNTFHNIKNRAMVSKAYIYMAFSILKFEKGIYLFAKTQV